MSNTHKRFVFAIGLFIALAISAPHYAFAQGGGHTLYGKVNLPTGMTPSQPVRIRLLDNGAPIGETFTDASGSFTFRNVRNGTYTLIADGDDRTFETTMVEVEIFFSSGNRIPQTATRNVTLTPKAESKELKSLDTRELDASIPKDARKEYDKGMKCSRDGKSTDAIEKFEKAIQIHSNYYNAHIALGMELTKARNFEAARKSFNQALEIKPKSSEAHLQFGIMLVKSESYGEAVPTLRESMELGEKGWASHLFLGIALMEVGNYDESEKMLLKALDYGGNIQPSIRLYLANYYNRVGNKSKTIDQLEAYVREIPTASNAEDIKKLIKKLKEQSN